MAYKANSEYWVVINIDSTLLETLYRVFLEEILFSIKTKLR